MALTDTAVKNAKPDLAKPTGYKLADTLGFFLLASLCTRLPIST